jgi:signal transduction histidine kinase
MIIGQNDASQRHSPRRHAWTRHVAAYATALLWAIPVSGQDTLTLTGPTGEDSLGRYYSVYVDEDWSKTVEDMAGQDIHLFQPHPDRDPDFGYSSGLIWLRMAVENATPDQRQWRLYMHENFKDVVRIYVEKPTGIEQVLDLSPTSTFYDRPIEFPDMVAPLILEPGETATLYIAYWSEGSTYLKMSVETIESFTHIAARKSARNFIFYGMMLLMIIAATVALVFFRHGIFLAYAGYATAAFLYVMHADGVTFQYLWPNAPRLNALGSIFAGSALIICGANYARVYLKTALLHPLMDKGLLTIIGATVVLNAVLFFVDTQLLKKSLTLMSLIAVIFFAGSAMVAALGRFREVRFYLLAWVGAVLSATLLNMRYVFGIEISQEAVHDSIRGVMVFDAAMMGLAIADRYNQLRQSRQEVLKANLTEAERNLRLNRRLSELEKRYELAQHIARTRSEQIQNTVHDLRQPLHALRLNVENQMRDAEDGKRGTQSETIEATFSYLETLISEQLQQSVTEKAPVPDHEEDVSGARVLASIRDMFAPDANEKGLKFRAHLRDFSSPVPPLVLMRIVTNLVSNAIKYTENGGVLIGVRCHEGVTRIEVHDTGPGLTPDTFADAQKRAVRLNGAAQKAEGHGLGLSIALGQANAHGLTIALSELRKSGTGIILTLPERKHGRAHAEVLETATVDR